MTTPSAWALPTWPELLAVSTAAVCVWLTIKNKISNWPWGIVSVLFYAIVFWRTEAYANFGLQLLYYLPCCIYGWWHWAKCGPTQNDDLPIRRLSLQKNLLWLGITIAIMVGIGGPIAARTHDPYPYADSITTGLSIMAQWMQAKKWFENWWYWIVVDAIYAFYLFPALKLNVSAVLYFVFMVMAMRGAAEWKRQAISEPVHA